MYIYHREAFPAIEAAAIAKERERIRRRFDRDTRLARWVKKRLDVILPRKYEACLSCGQLIMEADEGACGCDLREGVKERVDLVLRSDYEKLRQRWGRQSGTIDRERGRAFKAEAERDQARIQLLGELAEFFELQGQMLQAKAEYASERVRPVKAVYQEVAAHCRKLAQEGGE